MRAKPRKEDPKVNIVLWSRMKTSEDNGKQREESEWVRKALEKEFTFDLKCTREKFMEAKKIFAEAFTSGSQDKPVEEMDPSMLTTFLETCMKLLHNSKVVKGL